MAGLNIGDEVRSLVGTMECDNPDLSVAARVRVAWSKVINEEDASHVNAVYIVPHTQAQEVVVYVDTTIRAADLNMRAEVLRMRLNLELASMDDADSHHDREQIRKLKFVVSSSEYARKGMSRAATENFIDSYTDNVEPVPLDDNEENRVGEIMSMVDDDGLRTAMYDAMKAQIEWRKGENNSR